MFIASASGPVDVEVLWQRSGVAVTACPERLGQWSVTHVLTGLAISPAFNSMASPVDAIRAAELLAELGDWSTEDFSGWSGLEHDSLIDALYAIRDMVAGARGS